jgi:antitoxin PrlF
MNMHAKIGLETIVNMTSKGQVLIPKAIREGNGLVPGLPVRVGINDQGDIVILPLEADMLRETMFASDLAEAQAIFRSQDQFPGVSTDAYMAMLREPVQPFEAE